MKNGNRISLPLHRNDVRVDAFLLAKCDCGMSQDLEKRLRYHLDKRMQTGLRLPKGHR